MFQRSWDRCRETRHRGCGVGGHRQSHLFGAKQTDSRLECPPRGDHVIDQHESCRGHPGNPERRNGSRVVASCTSSGMYRRHQRFDNRNPFRFRDTFSEDNGRVEPVLELSGPDPGHGYDRYSRKQRGEDRRHQVRVAGQPPILELMHQGTGRPRMLEGGHQTYASAQDSVRSRSHQMPAALTEQGSGRSITRLAEHVPKVRAATVRVEILASCAT